VPERLSIVHWFFLLQVEYIRGRRPEFTQIPFRPPSSAPVLASHNGRILIFFFLWMQMREGKLDRTERLVATRTTLKLVHLLVEQQWLTTKRHPTKPNSRLCNRIARNQRPFIMWVMGNRPSRKSSRKSR